MSVFTRLQETQVTPKTAGICIGVLLIICTVAVGIVRNSAVSEPGPRSVAKASHATVQTKLVVNKIADPADQKDTKAKVAAPSSDEDVCQIIADRNIFKPVSATPSAPDSPRRPPIGTLPPMPVLPGGFGFSRGGGGGSAKNLAFTGIVETPDGRMALIENTQTGETRFARAGETVFGANLINVSARTVSLNAGGEMTDLALGENKTDATAAAAAPAAATAAATPATPATPAAAPTPTAQPDASAQGFQGRQGRRGRRGGFGMNGGAGQ